MSKNILGQSFGSVSLDLTTGNITSSSLTGSSEIVGTYLTANRGIKTDGNKKLISTTATDTEIETLQGVSSNIQTQLNNLQSAINTKEPIIDSSNRLNANLIGDNGNISNTEYGFLNGLSSNIQTQLNAKIELAGLQIILQGYQTLITNSNRLNANLIGANGNVSNTEYGFLNGVSSSIQNQLNSKQPEITSSNRLDLTLCGAGNVDNQDFAKLTLASDLTDTIKNILTQPSTKLIQAGTGLTYNNSTTPPTLNTNLSQGTGITINGNQISVSNPVGIRCLIRNTGLNFEISTDSQNLNANQYALKQFSTGLTQLNSVAGQECRMMVGGNRVINCFPDFTVGIGNLSSSDGTQRLNVNGNFRTQHTRINGRSTQGYITHSNFNTDLPGNPNSTTTYQRNFSVNNEPNANNIFNGGGVLRLAIQGGEKCRLLSNGNFGIGTQNPSQRLNVNGNIVCNQLTQTSDDRIKDNEEYIENALETIMKLRPQIYDKYDDLQKSGTPQREAGLITQEVYYQAPELRHLVILGKEKDEYIQYPKNEDEDEGVLSVKSFKTPVPVEIDLSSNNDIQNDLDYNNLNWSKEEPSNLNYLQLIPYLIKSIQELKAEVDSLKNI